VWITRLVSFLVSRQGGSVQQTLVLIKPDGVQRSLIGEITSRLERRGLRLIGMKFMAMSRDLAERHYAVHKGKDFYDSLIAYITSGPVVAMVWEGHDAIEIVRNLMGKTRPSDSPPGTIRGDFGMDVGRNLIHGSDSPDTAQREIPLFFDKGELVKWNRATDPWIFEPD
jgi:nucleoside-diphosphate kinase